MNFVASNKLILQQYIRIQLTKVYTINHTKIYDVQEQDEPSNIHFALQDLEDFSPEYLQAAKADGYTFVLIGHSEVRQ